VTTSGDGRSVSIVTAEQIEAEVHSVQQQKELKRWGRIATFWSLATLLGHWVLWPLPMYAAHYVFSKDFYAAWLIIAIIWLWGTLFVAGFAPLWSGRDQILSVFRSLTGRRSKVVSEDSSAVVNSSSSPERL
jgi:hypothetical protein